MTVLEGFIRISEQIGVTSARCCEGKVVSAGRVGPWHVPGLDEGVHSSARGDSWLAWSGRAWWREARAASSKPVDSNRLLERLLVAGPPALSGLDGSFAVAWFKAEDQTLFLARDYFGIEPLHYALFKDKAVFASRATQLLELLEERPAISARGLRDYLVYCFCPGELTLLEGLLRVPAGGVIRLRQRNGRIVAERRRWYRLSYRNQNLTDDDEICDAFEAGLRAAVLRRIDGARGGVMLSGGLDSSAVASIVRESTDARIRAFTFRCEGKTFDESWYAVRLSAELGMEHVQLDFTEQDALGFADAVAGMDSPFSNAGIEVGTWLVARAAAGDVDYMLTGDGGDEIWASHPVYAAERVMRLYDRIPIGTRLRRALRAALSLLPDSEKKLDLRVIAKRLFPDPDLPPALRHLRWRIYHSARELRSLLDQADLPCESDDQFYESALEAFDGFDGDPRSPDAMLYNDYSTSMAFFVARLLLFRQFGVEPRMPFFDPDLVSLGARIPFRKKLEGVDRTKRLFRRSMRGIVPDVILQRIDKLGHSVPMKNWLRRGGDMHRELCGVVLEELADRRGIVRRDYVEKIMSEHEAGKHNHSHRLWSLYVLELWLQRHLDGAQHQRLEGLSVATAVGARP